ncbi:MAG: G1 family glutamic endopeptidase [Streptosporangiaceae bacterium]
MPSRRFRRHSRRRPASPGPVRYLGLIVAGSCVAVLVIAYTAATAHGQRAVDTASVGTPAAGGGPSGWGRGGYTMMPGPAGSAPSSAPGLQAPGFAANATAVTSQNWAGYTAAGNAGTFTSVAASWTEPAVTCTAANTFASFWAGLDGDGTNTVEQTGTEADCDGGAATYQGWFEMFPNAPVFYNNPVEPGDAMSASVTADGGGAFTLTLADATQGWTQTTNQTSDAAQLGSAEVIAEAPSNGTTVLPLSNFGTVSFTGVTADNAAIGNENPAALTMVSANDVTEATPSALAGGNAFTVTWDSNGTAATAAPAPSATATAPGTGIPPGRHHHHWFGG